MGKIMLLQMSALKLLLITNRSLIAQFSNPKRNRSLLKLSRKNPSKQSQKKVKKKDPISLDLFTALQVKKQQPKKNATVLTGKLKKEPIVKSVRNALDSSAPTKKRGKEREGGKKKKKTL